MGEHISEGMRGEIAFAEEHGIPTFFMREPTVPLYYPISADENHLLSRMDCTPDGAKENYEGKMVLLRHENLAGKYRTPINQLWLCTHGPRLPSSTLCIVIPYICGIRWTMIIW